MKYIRWINFLALFGFCLPFNAVADPEAIRNALSKAMPGVEVGEISESPVKGFYEVTVGPNLYYVSEEGRYLLNGNLFDLEAPPDRRDLTEAKMGMARARAIQKIGEGNVVRFQSPLQKHVVSVFTDVDCGYCRKLHAEINEYLKQGITVDYLFYPRAGVGSESYKKAVAVWCADDRQNALTKAKLGEPIEMKECSNPVSQHMELAGSLQIRGTPMI
ncbi:MAG: DsbC family protein, partial [Methylococcaceae bacterium]|nr:DsbC family protein [Methylococcaceae bacterium]